MLTPPNLENGKRSAWRPVNSKHIVYSIKAYRLEIVRRAVNEVAGKGARRVCAKNKGSATPAHVSGEKSTLNHRQEDGLQSRTDISFDFHRADITGRAL